MEYFLCGGRDARKTAFPQDISQGKDKEFLRDVLNTYRSNNESADLRGRCGYSIGSREYLNYAERKVPLQDLPAIYSDDYDGGIKGSLEDIARQLQRDLSQNERENNYITDDTARNLRAAVSELEHCGIFLKEVQIRIRGSLFSEQINRMVVSIIRISIRLRDEASKAESTIHLNFSVQI